jgi:hypothetical protein
MWSGGIGEFQSVSIGMDRQLESDYVALEVEKFHLFDQ